jgi:hypothetical protein
VKRKSEFDPKVFNDCNPVEGIIVYPHGCIRVKRKSLIKGRYDYEKREVIQKFSSRSRQRLALVAKETDIEFESFITLTYGVNFPVNGLVVKKHLKKFIRLMKQWFGYFDYLWFFEFQKRGAPHIHIAVSLPPPTDWDRVSMSSIWADEVLDLRNWEYSRLHSKNVRTDRDAVYEFHLRCSQWEKIRSKEGIGRYALKYALKPEQKEPPDWYGKVGRFWGHSKEVGKLRGRHFSMGEEDVRRILREKRPEIANLDVVPSIIYDCFT